MPCAPEATDARSVGRVAYSPAEAAEALGLCRATIYNLINAGELRSVVIGRSRRIPAAELDRLLAGAA